MKIIGVIFYLAIVAIPIFLVYSVIILIVDSFREKRKDRAREEEVRLWKEKKKKEEYKKSREYKVRVRRTQEYNYVFNWVLDDILLFSKYVKYSDSKYYGICKECISCVGYQHDYENFEFEEPQMVAECLIEDLKESLPSNVSATIKNSTI